MQYFNYLALGDSYTIGEQVLLNQNFPYQFIRKMRKYTYHAGKQFSFAAPEIVAKTAWTTDELAAGIDAWVFDPAGYDMVSLLIGVNDQYRGRSVTGFEEQFSELLQKAIDFARGNSDNVYVLSIPDWGITPFAAGRDVEVIAREIDTFNSAAEYISKERRCNFLDITTGQREFGNLKDYLAPDGLHPSEKEYNRWADSLVGRVLSIL